MTSASKSIALLSFLLILPLGCTIHIKKPIAGIEKKVTVKEGTFLFQDLKVVKSPSSYGGPNISGSVINRTSKDWKSLHFEVLVQDHSGRVQKDFIMVGLHNGRLFKKGVKRDVTNLIWGKSLGQIKTSGSDFQIKKWDVKFYSGEYPASYNVKLENSTPPKPLSFADHRIGIQFNISNKQISYALSNKTTEPIKIDWDQVSYIDIEGESHKIIHSGIRLIDRAKPQSPTVIPPSAKITDIVYPSDYIYYEEGRNGGWRENPILPDAPLAMDYKGQSFAVFFPIEVKGKVENYLFKFIIEDVTT